MIPVGFGLSIVIAKNLFHSCLLKLLLQSTACRHLNQKLARACQCGKPSSLDAFQASTRPTHVTYAFLACILVRESAVYTTSAVSFGEASPLTIRLQMNEGTVPHKDVQNTYLPSLVCNLSPGAPGGTWVEDSQGTHLKSCSDGEVRRGRIVQGDSYRISARKYWHAAVLEGDARIMLIAWVPAGWKHLVPADVESLKGAGFTFPNELEENRAELSDWKGEGLVQADIRTTLLRCPRHAIWRAGVLRRMPPTHICLSSSDEEESAQDPGDTLRSEVVSVDSLPNGDDACRETVLD